MAPVPAVIGEGSGVDSLADGLADKTVENRRYPSYPPRRRRRVWVTVTDSFESITAGGNSAGRGLHDITGVTDVIP